MIVDDRTEAMDLVASGRNVVLIVDPDADPVVVPKGPGRLAILVGSPADPAVRRAAEELEKEVF